ncbi:MAG: tetratricopeptide repeat protein [Deltaproteobacteria bacterium]|nr:tetratricopeptide repeat protein [Deltaproteobacteria bacterium]
MHHTRNVFHVVIVILSVIAAALPAGAASEAGNTHFDLGVFAYESGKYDEAVEYFNKALVTGADRRAVYHYLGKTHMALEQFDEASRYLDWAATMNSPVPGLAYDRAMLYYRLGKHGPAADLFIQAAKRDPSNVSARYYAGICLYMQKRYSAALPWFDEAGEQSPTLKVHCAYYAGICRAKSGDEVRAQEHFRYVAGMAEDDLLKAYALSWLELYKARERAYDLYGKIGIQYDSNVVLEPVDEDVYADEDDWLLQGYVSGTYDLLRTDTWRGGIGYTHYQTEYSDLSDYDLITSLGQFYVSWRRYPVTLGLTYLPQYYWLDADSYLMRHQVRPEALWNVNDRLIAKVTGSYYRNNHFVDDGKDGKTAEGTLDAFYRISEQGSYLLGGIAYESNNARDEDNDYGQLRLKLGVTLVLTGGWKASAVGKYFRKEFEKDDTVFGITREDTKWQASLSVEKNLCYTWLSLAGDFTYTGNDSNIDFYTYHRSVTTLSLIARY